MKKLAFTLSLAFFAVLAMNQKTQAQESFPSVGLEIGMPMGDMADRAGIGIGGTVGYELGLSDQFAIGAEAGFLTFAGEELEFLGLTIELEPTNFIPIQAYARYYLDESRAGLFLSAKVGAHIHMYSVLNDELEEETETDTRISFAPEVGYFITENLSVAIRYQMLLYADQDDPETIEIEEDTEIVSYLALRAAWNF